MFLFFRRCALLALLFLGAVLVAPASASAVNSCQCGCRAADGQIYPSGEACTSGSHCTQAVCESACARLGATPTGGGGTSRTYACSEGEVAPPAPAPAPAPTTPTPDAPAAPAGAAAPAAGPSAPAAAGGGAAAPAASAAGRAPVLSGLRFSLPVCTETGNCTLTDIINTAVRFANFLLALSGVIFLATFLYAGAWLLIFAYDAGSIKKAQGMITGAFVGIVIIMVAGVAVRFVSTALGVTPALTQLPGATTGGAPATPRSLLTR